MTLTATFVDPRQILYFDANNRLQVGAWGVQVNATNIAYFKFASVVGFTMTSGYDTWGSGDIKFNPTTTANSTWEANVAGYAAIPGWNSTGTTVTKPSSYSITTNLDYVSTTVHTLANVKLGYGDPCQLIGYSGEEINAMGSLPVSAFRLPTNPENSAFVGYTGTPTDADIGASYVTFTTGSPGTGAFPNSTPANQILPAVGYQLADGSVSQWGTQGSYCSATPVSSTHAYRLRFTSAAVYPSGTGSADYGRTVRCVAK
ncbi:MAG: hypothetical protein LBR57_03530 [Alistipes sp.]|nr:hypothetical protein [Alistipes sp.]